MKIDYSSLETANKIEQYLQYRNEQISYKLRHPGKHTSKESATRIIILGRNELIKINNAFKNDDIYVHYLWQNYLAGNFKHIIKSYTHFVELLYPYFNYIGLLVQIFDESKKEVSKKLLKPIINDISKDCKKLKDMVTKHKFKMLTKNDFSGDLKNSALDSTILDAFKLESGELNIPYLPVFFTFTEDKKVLQILLLSIINEKLADYDFNSKSYKKLLLDLIKIGRPLMERIENEYNINSSAFKELFEDTINKRYKSVFEDLNEPNMKLPDFALYDRLTSSINKLFLSAPGLFPTSLKDLSDKDKILVGYRNNHAVNPFIQSSITFKNIMQLFELKIYLLPAYIRWYLVTKDDNTGSYL